MTLLKAFANFFKAGKCSLYDSIHTMPIAVWLKVHETGDLLLLVIKGKAKPDQLKEAWLKVRTEHAEEFGVNDNLRRYLTLRQMLIYAVCDYGLSPEPINETLLKIAERNLQTFIQESEGGMTINKMHGHLEKYMGRRLPREETTVFDFYNYARMLEEEMKDKKAS